MKTPGTTIDQKATFLLSRQALLDHIAVTQKTLLSKVTAYKPHEPVYQQQLIHAYLSFQNDLRNLKHRAFGLKSKTASKGTGDEKTLRKELEIIVRNFHTLLQSFGFLPA